MSATNRGAIRNERDFYPTPLTALDPILPYLRTLAWETNKDPLHIWEPACGDNRLVEAINSYNKHLQAFGSDIATGNDFLQPQPYTGIDVILTNPPFSLAFEFCKTAIDRAPHVFMLLPLNFLGSKKRLEFYKRNPVNALFPIVPRPSFTGTGTDACEYAWFYWGDHFEGIYH